MFFVSLYGRVVDSDDDFVIIDVASIFSFQQTTRRANDCATVPMTLKDRMTKVCFIDKDQITKPFTAFLIFGLTGKQRVFRITTDRNP